MSEPALEVQVQIQKQKKDTLGLTRAWRTQVPLTRKNLQVVLIALGQRNNLSMSSIHLNDVGTFIEATIIDENGAVVDISTATVKTFTFRKPTGVNITRTAVFSNSGTDGKIKYVTIAGDLDQTGVWSLQAYIEMPSGKFTSDKINFSVESNL